LNDGKRKNLFTKKIIFHFIFVFVLGVPAAAISGGFGAPQPVCRETGGLHTAIGYWYGENVYENGVTNVVRQNQIYSEAGYGFGMYMDVYARIGVSDLKMLDAFRSGIVTTFTNKSNFKDNWKIFGTLGAKGFYPLNDIFGVGVFFQGTCYFDDFSDGVAGRESGRLFLSELDIENYWEVNAGIGLQAAIPYGIKLYCGPYGYYFQARVSPLFNIAGLPFVTGDGKIKNKTKWGGYGGIVVPLGKGFQINVEGQYSERFSVGAAAIYMY
jgi:hypothetical protein